MTFLEALKTGRPMRRPWTLGESPWLYLGACDRNYLNRHPQWRRIDTGEAHGLHSFDYLADDWQVMP